MAEVTIKKTVSLRGEVAAPPSKAYTHRMLISSLLSDGISVIENYLVSDDTTATLNAIEAFGAKVVREKNFLEVKGLNQLKTPGKPVNCMESGATLRFMIPLAALTEGGATFIMGPSLTKRPIMHFLKSLKKIGIKSEFSRRKAYLKIKGGGIKGGVITLRGDISSQFISGLLFACPKAREDTEIILTTPLESRGYVDMTVEVLSKHGIKVYISEDSRRIKVPCNQKYNPHYHVVQGDFSSAAYLLAAAAVTSSRIKVVNLNYETKEGDRAILDILKQGGIEVSIGEGFVEVEGAFMKSFYLDARDIPDLVPVCAAVACYANGVSKIYNAKRLRYKESDRLMSIYTELKKMGANICMEGDGLVIKGPCAMHGAVIYPHGDHRIAMACAIAALSAEGETRILNAECVRKSYPMFFEDLKLLGANVLDGKFNW
ncbi:MAG: 3-phosphoshikimate 1-carboxyvinyltransferase [Candidatus Bathyarchaeia archaeon]